MTLLSSIAVAGCSLLAAPSAAAWGDRVPTAAPEVEANQPVVARGPDSITLLPISPRGATKSLSNDTGHRRALTG